MKKDRLKELLDAGFEVLLYKSAYGGEYVAWTKGKHPKLRVESATIPDLALSRLADKVLGEKK